MKRLKSILKIAVFSLLLAGFMLVCAFYTHPTFMEQNTSSFFPALKTGEFAFKKQVPCKEYTEIAPKLNDNYYDYIWNSAYQKFGEMIIDKEEIRPLYLQKKLILVDSTDHYIVDTLFHSYAFLTKDAKHLLDEIGSAFQEKLKNTSFRETRMIVTSLLRTEKTIKRLRRKNRNSIRISSHLHGTTFDLAHNEFDSKMILDSAEVDYLKEILAQTLYEFRKKGRCFVTYEIRQACFHVVNKKS